MGTAPSAFRHVPVAARLVHDTAVIAGLADRCGGVVKNLSDQTIEAIGAIINLS